MGGKFLHDDGNGGYVGTLSSGGKSTPIESVHGHLAGVETLTLGYTLGAEHATRGALRLPKNGKPGDVWVKEAALSDVDRVALLSLIAFVAGE